MWNLVSLAIEDYADNDMSKKTTPTPKDEKVERKRLLAEHTRQQARANFYEGCLEAAPILFCAHEWEYSEQSEPHKGRDYYTCRTCEKTAITNPDTGELIVLPQKPTRLVSLAIENYADNSKGETK